MKKVLAAIALSSVVVGGVVVSSDDAWAAADPSSLTLDCSTSASLAESLLDYWAAGENLVITAVIDDVIEIVAADDDCTIANVSGNAALDADGTANTVGANFVVANSGALTIEAGDSSTAVIYVDACSLPGSGIESDPWLVGDAEAAEARADFDLVGLQSNVPGAQSCSLAGHYLQTSIIMAVDNTTDYPIGGTFTGVYDGDHYTISFSGESASRHSLFQTVAGEVKRLKLGGTIRTTNGDKFIHGLLAESLSAGALVSEVEGTGSFELDGEEFFVGGLVGEVTSGTPAARIQYSKYSSTIEWTFPDGDAREDLRFGGLVGDTNGPLEIRDSYTQVTFLFDSSLLAAYSTDLELGGLVGGGGGAGSDALTIVRSYAVVTVTDLAVAGTEQTNQIVAGGLVGQSDDAGDDTIVSSFWNSSISTAYAAPGTGPQPVDYTVADPALPEAAPLSTSLLQTLSTYRSEEGETSGTPSGLSDLEIAASTGSLSEADYRWAIEEGNVGTFVASSYTDVDDYLTRELFADTNVEQSYRREGGGDLTVHGGEDPETVTGYPTLGRVWEICSGDSYPYLVWEERDCDGGGGGSSSRDNDDDDSTVAAAAALGLTEAEYAAYLASGLTLEQFKAQRLAATGPSVQALSLGGLAVFALFGLGLALVWVTRRERAHGRL